MSKLSPPYVTNLDLRTLNEVIIDIYKNLNIISDNANEVTFRKSKTGAKELVINDKGRKYTDNSSKPSFDDTSTGSKLTVNDLKITGDIEGGGLGNAFNFKANVYDIGPQFHSSNNDFVFYTGTDGDFKISGSVLSIINPNNSVTFAALLALAPYDTMIKFYSSTYQKWMIGNDPTVGATADANDFKIQAGAGTAFSDVSQLSLTSTGDLTIDGDLQVNGNDIGFDAENSTIGVDASTAIAIGKNLTIFAGSTAAGTADDLVGGDLTLKTGQGKGDEGGGSIFFMVAPAGSTGSSLNDYTTAMTISSDNTVRLVDDLTIRALEGENASIILQADQSGDNGDDWTIMAADGFNAFTLANDKTGSGENLFTILPNASNANLSTTSIAGNLEVNGTSGITVGAPIWKEFPFYIRNSSASRYYMRGGAQGYGDKITVTEYDTTPTTLDADNVGGQFVVPQNCTLLGIQGIVTNTSGTISPIISVYTGTHTEGTGTTTLAEALAVTVTVALNVPKGYSGTCNVDLDAGDIIVPTIHRGGIGNVTLQGSVTLKFITR